MLAPELPASGPAPAPAPAPIPAAGVAAAPPPSNDGWFSRWFGGGASEEAAAAPEPGKRARKQKREPTLTDEMVRRMLIVEALHANPNDEKAQMREFDRIKKLSPDQLEFYKIKLTVLCNKTLTAQTTNVLLSAASKATDWVFNSGEEIQKEFLGNLDLRESVHQEIEPITGLIPNIARIALMMTGCVSNAMVKKAQREAELKSASGAAPHTPLPQSSPLPSPSPSPSAPFPLPPAPFPAGAIPRGAVFGAVP